MALLNFPATPSNGDLYPTSPVAGQSQYRWEAASQTWRLLGVAVAVTPGTYGDATNVGQFTVDAQGRITSAVNVPITANVEHVSVPASSASAGVTGQVAFGTGYFYWYDGTSWQRSVADTTPW